MIIPPLNFARVSHGVYRSGFPIACNSSFLRKLGLRSILCLCPEEMPSDYLEWIDRNDLTLFSVEICDNREPFVSMAQESMRKALLYVLDERNHPILVHCTTGKNRTGCVVACLRAVQHWSFSAIFDEYSRHTGAAVKVLDMQFIELFGESMQQEDADSDRRSSASNKP